MERWRAVLTGFVVAACLVAGIQIFGAYTGAHRILTRAERAGAQATSVQEQQLVATLAVRDAAAEQVRQNGVRNAEIGIGALLLLYNALVMSITSQRTHRIRSVIHGDGETTGKREPALTRD